MKNILVTGGAGFIGSNLIKRLFTDVKGATIVNIDNMNAYYDVSLKDYRLAQLKVESEKLKVDYHFVKGDIADKALIDKLFAEHKFDIVAADESIAVECKRYTWTETGNVPSAKMGFTNEAAFYLSFLPDIYEKYIVMLYSFHEKRHETLSEYYFRTNHHLLVSIKVSEYDPEKNEMRIISVMLEI